MNWKSSFLGIACILASHLPANIGPQGFHEFQNAYFVETGCLMGGGIAKALEAGFKQIRSLEIEPRFVAYCNNRFKEHEPIFD